MYKINSTNFNVSDRYLSAEEESLLNHAEMTVNILYEVAALRKEVNLLRLKELKRSKQFQEQFDSTNKFVGNMLSKLIDEEELKFNNKN